MTLPSPPPARQRPQHIEIEGLRAVAVLLVLIFHFFQKTLPGGYLGVDVFFVISGYLIFSIISRDLDQNHFSFREFYERRIRRLSPGLIAVLVATAAAGWLLMLPTEFRNLSDQLIAGATFTANLLSVREIGYFEPGAEQRLLLHLWSLGVEAQFYILFPVILVGLKKSGRSTTLAPPALGLISLLLKLIISKNHPTAAFYLPVTRFWEFSIGALLFAFETHAPQFRFPLGFASRGNLAVSLGMALILGPAIAPSAFRGWSIPIGMYPALGAALIIHTRARSRLGAVLLGNPVMRGIGAISYPLYLWHWPLLGVARYLSHGRPSEPQLFQLLAASFAFASATHILLERPFIRKRDKPPGTWILLGAIVAVLGAGLLIRTGKLVSRLGFSSLGMRIESAISDWEYPHISNSRTRRHYTVDYQSGPENAKERILLAGDSHMQQFWPKIAELSGRLGTNARSYSIVTTPGLPPLPDVRLPRNSYEAGDFFLFLMNEAQRSDVSAVVLTAYWEHYFIGGYPDISIAPIVRIGVSDGDPLRLGDRNTREVLELLGQAIQSLHLQKKRVIVILSTPECRDWDPKVWSQFRVGFPGDRLERIPTAEFRKFIEPVNKMLSEVVLANGGEIIDPIAFFADGDTLGGMTPNGVFRYKDSNHIRPFFVKERASFLEPLLRMPEASDSK